jgi:hypothetical protein
LFRFRGPRYPPRFVSHSLRSRSRKDGGCLPGQGQCSTGDPIALIEERMGAQADWNAVDSLMQKALAAAEKVARYRHAQLSAVRLAGDINAGNNDVTLDELLVTIKSEMVKLGPLIGLDPNQLLLFQGAENRSPVKVNGSEPAAISPLRRRSPGMGVSSA